VRVVVDEGGPLAEAVVEHVHHEQVELFNPANPRPALLVGGPDPLAVLVAVVCASGSGQSVSRVCS